MSVLNPVNNKIAFLAKIFPILIIGTILGIVSSMVPLAVSLGAIIGLVFLVVVLKKAEIGIIIIVALISSIIFEESLPLIPIGVGSLHITDIIIIALIFNILWKHFMGTTAIIRTPLDIPIIIFYSICIISAFISIKFFGTEYSTVIRTLRLVTYYLIFFIITNYISTFNKLKFLIKGLVVIATIVSIAMLIQSIIGDTILLMPGRIEKSGTFEEFDTLRILPPGQLLLYVMFITGICTNIIGNKNRIYKNMSLLSVCLLGIGIILTYNRTYWLSIIMVTILLYFLIKPREKKYFLFLTSIVLVLILFISTLTIGSHDKISETIHSVTERFSSVFAGKKLISSSSLDYRYIENEFALKKIRSHLLLGNGLGNSYRPNIFGSKDELTSYIHNGYYWILLNTGVIGFVFYFWFYVGFIARSYKYYKKLSDSKLRPVMAGFLLSGIGILPMALLNPIFMQWYSVVVLAIIIGMNEVIIKLHLNTMNVDECL
ncbi:MAG TPA: O-antigen ligase family protein [Negativicutes bacterium]|jgi:hypothetical protein